MHTNSWITIDIETSSTWKRGLYIRSRNSNNSLINKHYKTCHKILADSIKEAKRLCYNNQISNSTNKIKTTRKIVNLVHVQIPVMQQLKL